MKKRLCSAGLALALLLSLSTGAAAAATGFRKIQTYVPGQFSDVASDLWCAANVQSVYECGIMLGKTEDRFAVKEKLTAAQTVVMACRLHAGYYGKTLQPEKGDPWYQPYLEYAARNGIVWQPENGNYQRTADRSFFVRAISSALPDAALSVINSVEEGGIPDVNRGDACYDAVYRLYRAGILTGNDAKGTFGAKDGITRGAAAAILSRVIDPSLRKSITLKAAPFEPVPLKKLANYKSLKKKMSDAEFQAAYEAARKVVEPLAKKSREEQLLGIAIALREMVESGQVRYSTEEAHYNDPYGYFVKGVASCAGCTRATGLCLNMLGISYEHVNEGQWSHQWCRVNMGNGEYWICDAYGLYCGSEPYAYGHPYL